MKKSLIALAAVAAVSAASAQTSVTLYGVVDIGYGTNNITSRDGTAFTRTTGVLESNFAGPRIGFRGVEDLGGGLKAEFVVEQGISLTTPEAAGTRVTGAGPQVAGIAGSGYGTGTNRQSYIGLNTADLGTFRIGYQYTNFYELSTLSGYMFGTEGPGGVAHTGGSAQGGGSRANGLTYISPAFAGGFTVRAQYGSTTSGDKFQTNVVAANGFTTNDNRRMGLMGQYANGPLSLAVGFSSLRSTQANGVPGVAVAGAATNVFGGVGVPGTVALTGVSRSGNVTQLGGSYDFGVAKIGATYNNARDGGTSTSIVSSKTSAYQVGITAPFGAFAPYALWGRSKARADGAALDTADITQYQIGAKYNLSKRTFAYVNYGQQVDNGIVAAATAGYKTTRTVAGLTHSF